MNPHVIEALGLLGFLFASLAGAQISLEGKSFSIRSTVRSLLNSGSTWISQIHESYSLEQRRAKLSFTLTPTGANELDESRKPSWGDFYIERERNIVLLYDRDNLECREASIEEMTRLLGMSEADSDPATPDLIVGPARLIFFISKHRDKLKLVSTKNTSVRNIPAFRYVLDDGIAENGRKFEVYYSQVSQVTDPLSTIPIQIVISGSTSEMTVIDYARLEILELYTPRLDIHQQFVRDDVALDRFTFETVSGCSKALASKKVDLFRRMRAKTGKFSFQADSEFTLMDLKPILIKSFVAYDEDVESLRLDLSVDTETSGVRRQMFNFGLNRMYHAMERVPTSNTHVDKIFDLSKDASPSNLDGRTDTTQCIVSQILPNSGGLQRGVTNPFSIGEILAGAKEFVYMGKAKVRGIDASVYETYDTTPPYWLDQPIVYKDSGGEIKVRSPAKGVDVDAAANKILVTLLYFAEKDEDHPLLLIQIYQVNPKYTVTHSKQAIFIHDFVWALPHEAPNGDRMADLFSLEDLCSSGLGENKYAKVGMLLESDEPSPSEDFLKVSDVRDLALIAGLQESFKWPANMIYDLETRIVKHGGQLNAPNGGQTMLATLRVAEHAYNLAQLIYVGQGRLNYFTSGEISTAIYRSFQACYMLAAHIRKNVHFGYNVKRRTCSIDLKPTGDDKLPVGFVLDKDGAMEIYRTNHGLGRIQTNGWFESTFKKKNTIRYLNSKLILHDSNLGASLSFTVKLFKVDDRDFKTSISSKENNEQQVATDKISGFGLPELGSGNKRVVPALLSAHNWTPLSSQMDDEVSSMTIDQCRAACLVDFTCRSFSLCMKNSELECVISKTSFSSLETIDELTRLKADKRGAGRRGAKVSISVDGEQVELEAQPSCQLYNKLFTDLYGAPSMYVFRNRRVHPVGGIEECAEKCTVQNMEVLRREIADAASKSSALFAPGANKDDLEAFSKLYRLNRDASRQMCRSFNYLGKEEVQDESEFVKIERLVLAEDRQKLETSRGYCIVNDYASEAETEALARENNTAHNSAGSEGENQYLSFTKFSFKFEIFYEKQYGVSLGPSNLSDEEANAYRMVSRQVGTISESTYATVRSLFERGENFREQTYTDEQNCAFTCFMQVLGPWPACRSFDIIIQDRNGQSYYVCVMNTITLRQAISTQRLDLVEDSSKLQVWHYEPRAGFASDESKLRSNIEIVESSLREQLGASNLYRIHAFGITFLAVFAIISGIFLGIKLGAKFVGLLGTKHEDMSDKDKFVESTAIEFVNQVNSNQVIPE